MITLLVLAISLAILFSYLALTKPKQMPFIGHFFDKIVYGSLYYFNKPDEAHIYASRGKIKLKLFVFMFSCVFVDSIQCKSFGTKHAQTSITLEKQSCRTKIRNPLHIVPYYPLNCHHFKTICFVLASILHALLQPISYSEADTCASCKLRGTLLFYAIPPRIQKYTAQ